MEPAPGMIIEGRFELVTELGSGGSSSVWKARDRESSDRWVALKLLHSNLVSIERARSRMMREAELLNELQHAGIARAFDFREEGDLVYFVLELVDGISLKDALSKRSQAQQHFQAREVINILAAIADALDHAHALGVIHRDLTPGNIMLTPDSPFPIKILDFGLAKVAVEEGEETTLGRVMGSRLYMSPEQARGDVIDHRTDLFAFGAIAFEMMTLHRCFARDDSDRPVPASHSILLSGPNSRYEIMRRIALSPRPRVRLLRPELSPDVDLVLLKALAPDPRERFLSAKAMLSALVPALNQTRDPPKEPTVLATGEAERSPRSDPRAEPGHSDPSVTAKVSSGTPPVSIPTPTMVGRRPPILLALSLLVLLSALLLAFFTGNARTPSRATRRPPAAIPRDPDPIAEPRPAPAPPPPAPEREVRPRREVLTASRPRERSIERGAPPPPKKSALEELRTRPNDADLRKRVEQDILRRAGTIDDPVSRESIQRCVTLSRVSSRIDDLVECAHVAGIE